MFIQSSLPSLFPLDPKGRVDLIFLCSFIWSTGCWDEIVAGVGAKPRQCRDRQRWLGHSLPSPVDNGWAVSRVADKARTPLRRLLSQWTVWPAVWAAGIAVHLQVRPVGKSSLAHNWFHSASSSRGSWNKTGSRLGRAACWVLLGWEQRPLRPPAINTNLKIGLWQQRPAPDS